jgi:hypothetical protein
MWSGAQGSAGTSLNFYNPRDRRWQQLWVWRNGTTLNLAGGLVDGEMALMLLECGSRRSAQPVGSPPNSLYQAPMATSK